MNKSTEKSSPTNHPSALIQRCTLGGHKDVVYKLALSPDGQILASPSDDGTVRLWNIKNGHTIKVLKQIDAVFCVSWSPDGMMLASGDSRNVCLWNVATGQLIRTLEGHFDKIKGLAWSPNGKMLASCSNDRTIRIWDMTNGNMFLELKGHKHQVEAVVWSSTGERVCTGSWDNTVRLWNAKTGKEIYTIQGHKDLVKCVAWSPDGKYIVSGSADQTIRIWDSENGEEKFVLEGHTNSVDSVFFLDKGRLLVSRDQQGSLIFWETDTWHLLSKTERIGYSGILTGFAVHPTLPLMATLARSSRLINIWDLDLSLLRDEEANASTRFYVNAKAVLLGDSGVGKSGLGIHIAEGEFRPTDGSTHGAQFWHFPTEQLPSLPSNVYAELTLWDLAGQPEYRLTHQLFLDDTDAALLLFDCSDSNDPFRGVPYWAKVLKKRTPQHTIKYLVSARSDVSPVTVDRHEINNVLAEYEIDEYFRTSAKTGEGVKALFQHLLNNIHWDRLPRTNTPVLFQIVREFLLECKSNGGTLVTMNEIQRGTRQRLSKRVARPEELDTVVKLLQSRGLVMRLDTSSLKTYVLLKPELINQYGASIIQAARNHPHSIGAVTERDVLIGNLSFSGFSRLTQLEEMLLLEATGELLIRHDLCFREMGYLIFPSQINVTRLQHSEPHPRTEVAYRFSGGIETIYASLVVRLSYTDYFLREDQWKYAVEFSRDGYRLGFSMKQVEEGTGELEIYFYPGLNEFDRVTFIRFVTDHLRTKGIDIQEQIRLYCPKCGKEVTNREAIEARIQRGKLDIPCLYCDAVILIPKSIEERYRRDSSLSAKQRELAETVVKRTEAEVLQFQEDQLHYTGTEDQRIHILHLSDLHIESENQAQVLRMQLETDLIHELKIRRLEYLIISGDIVNHATEKEFRAAFMMVDGLVKRFGLDSSRVIIVPGNHDLNWDNSESAYKFIPKRKLKETLDMERIIPAGDTGSLVRDDTLYSHRFTNFNNHFYRRVYNGQDYALDYAEQFRLTERDEDHILILGLNSCWQIDHHFHNRASIYMPALTRALDQIQEKKYAGWLKLAVWHHPVTGIEMMNNEFLQLLAVHGFQVCLHGHIHEAIEQFYNYDKKRGIHIVGAGTFGAPIRQQVIGIPLQYNLLTFDSQTGDMTVQSRKKEKPDGTWSADSRWEDKNNPKPWYQFRISSYKLHEHKD